MIESSFPKGSEWRKWDLQVHTPFSALNNGFGQDFDEYAKRLLTLAVDKEIAVIGITDYFSIEGYRRLRELVRDIERLRTLVGAGVAGKAKDILLLPNVELRANILVNNSRVNFHVIFSDELDPAFLDEHFFRELKFTSESTPGGVDDRWSLTIPNLELLGQKLKGQHSPFQNDSDLFVGMMNAVVSHEDVTKVLEQQSSRFKDNYLIVVPPDEDLSQCGWNGQAHLTRKLPYQKSHMFFSANSKTRDFGLGLKHPTPEAFEAEFKSRKPCIHGSDSHDFESLFEPAQKRYLWIKADPTFPGLRQLLYEPASRVFIGEMPEPMRLVRRNTTKFVREIEFSKVQDTDQEQQWFSGAIELNHGLVALIGNKGSGKSALADVIALLGNTRASTNDFSFLRDDRFLSPKGKLGKLGKFFEATVKWEDGASMVRRLDEKADPTAPELVKYIPQNYLEKICSELKESSETEFDRELMDVIFSHVKEADKLEKNSLKELIDSETSETERRIELLVDKLEDLNEQIEALEEKTTPDYRKGIDAQLKQRKAEISAHDATKPETVPKPEQDLRIQASVSEASAKLGEIETQISQVENQISVEKGKDANATSHIAAANRLLSRISNLEQRFQDFLNESSDDERILSLKLSELVTLNINQKPIQAARTSANELQKVARAAIDLNNNDSLTTQLEALRSEVEKQRANLDEPNRIYQRYLEDVKAWEEKRRILEGGVKNLDSVKGLEAQLHSLDKVPDQVKTLEVARANITRQIFEAKEQLLAKYRELYAPVQSFIDQDPISKAHGALQFRASVVDEGLVDGLLQMIHQGRTGTFHGDQEGRDRLLSLVKEAEFTSADGTLEFIEQVMDRLKYDRRDPPGKALRLKDQLNKRFKPKDVYDFLFGLKYLHPRFELQWQDKPLDQLSPGERGNLLLVFYLLIDQRDVPLIIDQPEENLDNQTIATMLVPAVGRAKERRQIIMVTHNPNLAVVCDAEQIVYASIDKVNGNKVTYTSGSIENPQIVQLIVDILEGTKPAFDLRGAKYRVLGEL